ncbi:hypothetical protein CL634_10505 [bacterium]|nr:hypothetical protein [bacterium]
MWAEAVSGISLANLDSLKYYRDQSDREKIKEDVCLFVNQGIRNLPFFFYVPLRAYGILISSLCFLTKGSLPDQLTPSARQKFVRRLKILPFFGTMNKLIGAMVFLRLFDHISPTKEGNLT